MPANASEAAPTASRDRKRPNIRERQRNLTREALLSGAAEAFAESGYNAVTIEDIALRAGTSRGTFYLYFTKGQILAELILRVFSEEIGGTSETALLPDLKLAEPYDVDSLMKWLREYVETWERNSSLVRAWMEGEVSDPEVQELTKMRVARAVELWSEILLARRKTRRKADKESARAHAVLLDLQLQYFCFYVVVRRLDTTVEAGLRALAEQWHAVIHSQA
ncbi:TetR/AcrR family transcriptional regulator [Rhodococcus ruber]|uniref:TetR/AcrR family transcriptional regulator n=1 Tax=Rhodococcus ruber TaxID=1830 RepID=A0ABT4MES1_9NOCA|nr:TetR/AcrR family transcriptional regulator [Rhodococcus ruber]MCZ4519489.1 TetR/AcrR family transcriptional regulator [Rhodococcus ruber]